MSSSGMCTGPDNNPPTAPPIGEAINALLSSGQEDETTQQVVSSIIGGLPSVEHSAAESVLTGNGEKVLEKLAGLLVGTAGEKLRGTPLVRECAQLISYIQSLLKGNQTHGAAMILDAAKHAANVFVARQGVSLPLAHKEHFLEKVITASIQSIRKRRGGGSSTTKAAAAAAAASDTEGGPQKTITKSGGGRGARKKKTPAAPAADTPMDTISPPDTTAAAAEQTVQ